MPPDSVDKAGGYRIRPYGIKPAVHELSAATGRKKTAPSIPGTVKTV